MAQIHAQDLLEEASVSNDSSGLKATRKFLVTGLSGEGSARLGEALDCPGIPRKGETHPNLNILVSAVNAVPAPGCAAAAHVIVQYEQASFQTQPPSETAPVKWRYGSVTEEVETSRDKDGNDVYLEGPAKKYDDNGNVIQTVQIKKQPMKVSVQIPSPYFQAVRPEPAPFNFQKTVAYTGKVNASPWRGFPARTVLCLGIEVNEESDRCEVSYQFKYREQTWDVTVICQNPFTNAPIEDPAQGVGIKTVRVLPEIDFGGLGIAF